MSRLRLKQIHEFQLSNSAAGDYLYWNGTKWVNNPAPAAGAKGAPGAKGATGAAGSNGTVGDKGFEGD